MKYFLLMIAGVCLFLLNGCVTVCETESPALTAKFSPETRLRLEGFQLMIWQATQRHVGRSSAAVYDYRTNSWTTEAVRIPARPMTMCRTSSFHPS